MGDEWSELPSDILAMIHQCFVYYADKFRFSCVCTHWRSSSAGLSQPPWLLWPYKHGPVCVVAHPLDGRVYHVDVPGGSTNAFLGSHNGWVIALQRKRLINVVNPISKIIVPLPSKDTFPDAEEDYYIKDWLEKIAISGNPSSHDFKAVALYKDNRLAYCKVGDKEWHEMVSFDHLMYYKDISFSGGKLYVICHGGEVLVCDDIVSCPKLRICCVSLPNYWYVRFRKDYLCSDGLVILGRPPYEEFRLFKLDLASSSWIPLKSLGDQSVFASPSDPTEISYPIAEGTRSVHYPSERGIPPRYRFNLSSQPIWFIPDDILPLSRKKIPSKKASQAKAIAKDTKYKSLNFYKSVGFKAIAKDDLVLLQFENLHAELDQQLDSEEESEKEVGFSDSEEEGQIGELILENMFSDYLSD